jgi:hypothetical protein
MDNHEHPINGHHQLLSSELLRAAQEAEASIRSAVEHIEGKYLAHRQVVVLRFGDDLGIAELTGSGLVRFFSPARRMQKAERL